MLSIESAKNQEDLFQIKAAIMRQKLKDIGGRKGVVEILALALDSHHHRNFQKSLKILEPLINVIKDHPFESSDSVDYVSISDEMEWALHHNFFQKPPKQVRNVSDICPIEHIWRQYGLSALEEGDLDKARDATLKTIQWNPASAKYRLMLAMTHCDEGALEKILEDVLPAMKFVYKPGDLVCCFRFLRDYYLNKKMYKESLYCSALRSRFTTSDSDLKDIVDDMLAFINVAKFDCDKLTNEDLAETCQKCGFTPGFNPEVLAVAQRCYQESFLAGDSIRAAYFAKIMADFKTVQEKRDAVNLRQLLERSRNIVS